MPEDRITAALAAIESNWFIGGNSGTKFTGWLRQELTTRGDRPQIDSALSLGHYFWHTDEKKRVRDAIRAVMLAHFLYRNTPLGFARTLRTRLAGLSLGELQRAFRSCFPAFEDSGKRDTWDPSRLSLSPQAHRAFLNPEDWTLQPIPNYKIMVHTLKWDSVGDLLTTPGPTLAGWDAISMSVISKEKPFAYSNFGLVVSVPKNNILVTSVMDAWFDNRAGGTGSAPGGKASGLSMAHHVGEKNAMVGGMLTPDEVLQIQNTDVAFLQHNTGTAQSKYNEIVVTGKPGVRLPHGVTGLIRIEGLFMQTRTDGTFPEYYTSAAQRAPTDSVHQAMSEAAGSRNLWLPLYYLPNSDLD